MFPRVKRKEKKPAENAKQNIPSNIVKLERLFKLEGELIGASHKEEGYRCS